jgi:SAM-dependent methyltransferase
MDPSSWGQENDMILPLISNIYHQACPMPVRRRILRTREACARLASKLKRKTIDLDACLLGGDSGFSSSSFARKVGDLRRASRPVSEWPHVKFLRQYDAIGEQIWDPDVFKQTEYYQNAALNIELFGRYHNAVALDQVQWGARRFVEVYRGLREILPMQEGESYKRGLEEIAVRPVMYSNCFHVLEGHHRLAIAYMKGARQARALITHPAALTPLQELLLDASWLKGRRELYQPIDSPEVAGWPLVRRCSDRLAKMTGFLAVEGLMPPVSGSFLDVASGYGWFVSEMTKAGFRAEGVELDPTAISIGTLMYGLKADQVHRGDSFAFLQSLQCRYDVTSCLSLMHHYLLNRKNVSAEELLRLLDSVTSRVMFFDMGQSHEYSAPELKDWDSDHIHRWLQANSTFTRVVRLGPDEDGVPPNQRNFGRMLFACVR